jgi:arsenate reductase
MKILVLCTGNSCRSQIAHGYLQHFMGTNAEVYSAGVETHGVNPRAIATMLEDGIDISHHSSTHVLDYAAIPFDYVITVCDHANEICPVFPGQCIKIHHSFPDPAKISGDEQFIMNEFARVRNLIKEFCRTFSTNLLYP